MAPELHHRAMERSDAARNRVRLLDAEREGWLGEVEGLQVSLAGAKEKLAQLDRRPAGRRIADLGIPTTTAPAVSHQPRPEERT
ncbi:hypothetical protein [Streptomyces sp. NBC_01235]|uniref:hypothetical protein n=1 Tax=Streptomyces sp. NBC_01235 TaxID=2903788 RepID=UPI002E0F1C59|nr:hypothetical protein OG289_06745 [Streptomyces sp. NBC_01235]